jgi:hypothetical protein
MQSLQVMWMGMAGIFVVMAVFYGLTALLQKMFPAKGE